MQNKEAIYKIRGKIMHYAWGGSEFLPVMLGIPNPENKPFAEYWMGAHPMAPADVIMPDGETSLFTLVRNHPDQLLSEPVANRFGELPFLLKLQDVKDILSIQVHPSKEEAEKGFDREESEGIPIGAPYRNYKDRNHKPEVMVALSEFWLLHGFRSADAIMRTLEDVPEFNVLLPLYRREGLQALYQFVMEMEQTDANALMAGLVKREIRRRNAGELTMQDPGWWVAKLYAHKTEPFDIDRATFSIYLFNIVKVNPGEAVFQAAGIPHAYMEGQCVELMANSDNVLRAGLTPKHIDIPELMKHTRFESITPDVMKGNPVAAGEIIYPCPVPDFGIAKIELNANMGYQSTARSLEIFVITEGGLIVNNRLALKRGEAFTAFAGQAYHLEASGNATVFRAFVPQI
jgi:mannose-6-phosphate isomerase